MGPESEFNTLKCPLEITQGAVCAIAARHPTPRALESRHEPNYRTIIAISQGLGLTGFDPTEPGFGGKLALRASFSPREADLKAHRGVCTPRACVCGSI